MKFVVVVSVLTAGLAAIVSTLSETHVSEAPLAAETVSAAGDMSSSGTERAPETTLRSGPPTNSDGSGDTAAPETTLLSDPPGSTLVPVDGHDLQIAETGVVPLRIRVEQLDIDLDVLSVGVDDEGDFDVPRSGIGWYEHGSAPGEVGSAVLAAHVDFGGAPGAFFQLETLVPGDVIEIDLSDGSIQAFEVVDQVLYDKVALPADELFDRSGDPLLQLITCGGAYDPDARSYHGNRVVTARPLAEVPG